METITPPVRKEPEKDDTRRDIADLAGGALVNFTGKLGRSFRGVFLWVVPLLYGLDVLGLYSLAWGLVSTFNRVACFGLPRGVVRFVVEGRSAGDESQVERSIAAALKVGFLASILVVGALLLSAEWFADFYGKPIAEAVRIMAWSAPFVTVVTVFLSAIRARRIMRYDVYVMSIAGPLILLMGGLGVGFASPSLKGIAWVQFAMTLGICLLAGHYFRRFYSLGNCLRRLRGELPWKSLARFSLPVMLASLIAGVLTQLDVFMLAKFVAQEEMYMVGIYVLARRIASSMLKAPQAFDPIFSSIVSELSYHNRQRELGSRFVVISRWILTINLPIFAGLLIVGDSLLTLLAGDQISAGDEILTLSPANIEVGIYILFLLCIGMMVQGMFAVIEPLLSMSGRPGLSLFNNVLWLVVNFSLNIWLIKTHGIVGAAIGAVLAVVVVNVIRVLQVYVIHDIQPFRRSQLKPLGAALGAALAGWLVRDQVAFGLFWTMVSSLVVFAGVYISLLCLLGLEAEDRTLLVRLRQRAQRFFAQHFDKNR